MNQQTWLPLDTALALAKATLQPTTKTQTVPLSQALNQVVSVDITAPTMVPPHHNSAMDGYAIQSADAAVKKKLSITSTVYAGQHPTIEVKPGECARIMTGAVIPPGADAVVIQENVNKDGDLIELQTQCNQGSNIRYAGDDVKTGDIVIRQGTRIEARHLMLLASLGLAEITVNRPLIVGIIATGDELVPPGYSLKPGQIFESNSQGISALLAPLGITILSYGIIKDDISATRSAFEKADSQCDVIISSGGVSVGDADLVKTIVAQLGSVDYWKVAIKPGKPFAFGKLKNAVFFGVPGNPVSSYVTTQHLVIPLLAFMQGESTDFHGGLVSLKATLCHNIRHRPGRTDFQRGWAYLENNQVCVKPLNKQSSGVMSTVVNANCYIVVPSEADDLQANTQVNIELFPATTLRPL